MLIKKLHVVLTEKLFAGPMTGARLGDLGKAKPYFERLTGPSRWIAPGAK